MPIRIAPETSRYYNLLTRPSQTPWTSKLPVWTCNDCHHEHHCKPAPQWSPVKEAFNGRGSTGRGSWMRFGKPCKSIASRGKHAWSTRVKANSTAVRQTGGLDAQGLPPLLRSQPHLRPGRAKMLLQGCLPSGREKRRSQHEAIPPPLARDDNDDLNEDGVKPLACTISSYTAETAPT